MRQKFGLSDVDIGKLNGVFAHYPDIETVVVYGSRAKGNYRPGSDIDLTITGHLDWPAFNRLEVELDDLLLPYQIDLSLYEHIDNTALIEHIRRVGQVLYSKQVM